MSLENNKRNLQELKGSDFEIADGQPDIIGWDIKDESGTTIGKVKDLLFDEASRKVRYIITKLDVEDDNVDGRKVLVPIGVARLHESDDDVIIQGISLAEIQTLPLYNKDQFTHEHEHSIRNVFARLGGAGAAGASGLQNTAESDFYNHHHFNEDNFYGSRYKHTESKTLPVSQEELQAGEREVEGSGVRLRSRFDE